MRDRQFELFNTIGPDTLFRPPSEPDPPISKTPAIVIRERASLPRLPAQFAREQIGLHQNLKPVADADDRFLRFDKFRKHIRQVMPNLIGKNPPRGDVIPVTKPPRNRQELVLAQERRLLQNLIHMQKPRHSPSQFKSMSSFSVTINASGSEDQRLGLHEDHHMRGKATGKLSACSAARSDSAGEFGFVLRNWLRSARRMGFWVENGDNWLRLEMESCGRGWDRFALFPGWHSLAWAGRSWQHLARDDRSLVVETYLVFKEHA